MSRNKQIEEIARTLCTTCDGDTMCKDIAGCIIEQYAEVLYNAGYRKQSENTVELPCKVGDTVYCIWKYSDFAKENIPFIQETRVISFVIDEGVPKIIPANYGEMTDSWHRLLEIAFTKEEAEEALAKMKGGAE